MADAPSPYQNTQDSEDAVERILVVDDDDKMLLVLKGGLEMAGFDISSANSVGDAEQLLSAHRYDLVISDVIMPDRSGVDLLKWTQKLDPTPAFILITGNPNADLVMDALNTGAHFFMRKPFKMNELHEAVSTVLAKQRFARSSEEFRLQLEDNNRVLRQRVLDAVVQQETLFLGCLSALAETIDARDPYTRQHSAAVASLARLMAR
ncbi:MAG: response regulator, partial [Planctomycetota bacterium]